MPSVQIKNVPPDVHAVLRRRAAARGQSLQEYLLAELCDRARTESVDELLARVAQRSGSKLTRDFVVDAIRAERDGR
jgi:plasmid stability protein